MKTVKYMDEDIVIKKATEALIKEIGPVETLRFINMPKRKRVESVKRHRDWQKMLNKMQFLNEVFAER